MTPFAPRRVAAAAVAFALVSFLALSSAFAGGTLKPDTSRADRFKTGKSGQLYSWRKGTC